MMEIRNLKTERMSLLDTDWNLTLNDLKTRIESELQAKGYLVYEIVHFSIFPKEKVITVTIDDKTEETKKVEELITRWNELKNQLAQVTDEADKIPILQEMMKINEEFKKLTGMNISEVV